MYKFGFIKQNCIGLTYKIDTVKDVWNCDGTGTGLDYDRTYFCPNSPCSVQSPGLVSSTIP